MPETGGVIPIGPAELALATGFVIFVGAISLALGLGLVKDLAIGTIRTYVQLAALGFVLRWVFGVNSALLVLVMLALMVVAAAFTVLRRAPDAPRSVLGSSMLAMALTGFAVTFAVTGLIVRVEPWYLPRYVIPIGGMVLGNSMTGIALAIERLFADMEARSAEMLVMTALGANTWEAARPSVRSSLRAGLIPTITSMSAVGIVFIPGMMTGQILAGADPLQATGYQIVVMLMVAAATALGSVVALLLTYHRRFTAEGVYVERSMRQDAKLPQRREVT